MDSNQTSSRRSLLRPNRFSQFDLKSLFGLILGFAVLFVVYKWLSLGSILTFATVVIGLSLLESRNRRILAALVVVMMLPYCWLLLIQHPWKEHHWAWISIWPTLPGWLATRLFLDDLPDKLLGIISGAATIGFLAFGIVLGRFNRTLFWLTLVFFGVASIVNSIILYNLYRS